MSDFYGCLSSSSFQVKDEAAWLSDPEVQILKSWALERKGFFEEFAGGHWAFGWYDQYPSQFLLLPNSYTCLLCNETVAPEDTRDHLEGHHPNAQGMELHDVEKQFAAGIEDRELDIADVIQRHIVPGEVCQIGVSGNEKLRYIGGSVSYVTSHGSILLDMRTAYDEILTLSEVAEMMRRIGNDWHDIESAIPSRS